MIRTAAPGHLLAATATATAGLSVLNLWWAVPAALAAFLAGRRPGPAWPAVGALAVLLTAELLAVLVVPDWLVPGSRLAAVLVTAGMLPWLAGRFWLQYRELTRAGWERAEQLERAQRLVAEQARLRERARIAQDMHDVLGHDLSLIALSAGALKLAPGLAESHRAAAGEIRARAAASVERLGEVIGVLREESDRPPRQSGSGLARLVDEASAAGLAVELRVEDLTATLPTVVERAVYRVVQEGLTNAAKHAPGAPVTVLVRHEEAGTEVRVANGPATGAGSGPGGGYGLIGLDERVRLAGGSLQHGPCDGGFTVLARLPHTLPPGPVARAAPPDALPQQHRTARRRVRRALAAAVALPLATGAALTGALMGWEMLSASRSVLDQEDWDRLRIGRDRAELAPLLPDRQTVQRPREAAPNEEGTTCEYYAVTADRFDDRSGDVRRLCFRQGRLVSLDTLTP